jgi:hypothetical protein
MSDTVIDKPHHWHSQLRYPIRVHTSTARLHSTVKERLAGPLVHPENNPRNVYATIRGASSEEVIIGILRCMRRLNFTSTVGRKKRVMTKTDAAAVACGAGDGNAL